MKASILIPQKQSEDRKLVPLFSNKVPAGFPSPADDFIENSLDLNDYLIERPNSTFLVKASGESMINAGIFNNDILVVDRSITPDSNRIVIAAINGELLVKRFIKTEQACELRSENPDYPTIPIRKDDDLVIWGVVTYVIHKPL